MKFRDLVAQIEVLEPGNILRYNGVTVSLDEGIHLYGYRVTVGKEQLFYRDPEDVAIALRRGKHVRR